MNSIHKPFSQACENNKQAILQVIEKIFDKSIQVIEIGSGTGQHACYFAQQLPHLCWQPTDKQENIAGIQAWLAEVQLDNLSQPLVLDVNDSCWPVTEIPALFTANTLHIMSWQEVEVFFQHLATKLNLSAYVCVYGPFNYNGNYTSPSNAKFDLWLKQRNSLSGIRSFEAIKALAANASMRFVDDVAMPANNRLLIFQQDISNR